MKDILRLGAYLRPYRARIALAVLSSFLASVTMVAFIALVRPIAQETLGVAAGGITPTAPAPKSGNGPTTADVPANDASTVKGAESSSAGAAAGAAAEITAVDPGGLKSRLAALQKRATAAIGIDRLAAWLHEAPYSRIPFFIVLIFLIKGIFAYFAEYWLKWVGYRTIQDLRMALYEKVLGQSARFFSNHPTGTLNSRVMGDVSRLQKITSTNLADAVRLTFTVLLMLGVVLAISWRLTVVCFVAMPLVIIPVVRFGRRVKAASRASQEKAAEVSNILNETVVGNRIVKAFGMEAFEKGRFRAALARMFRSDAKALRSVALTSPFLELVGATFGGALFWYAGMNITSGALDGPWFFMFLAALGYLFVSVKALSAMNNDLQQAMAAAARVFEMLDAPAEIVEPPHAREMPPFHREIRFDAVGFRYEQATVLDGIELTASAGEVHALVGSSGAGKTSMVNLIPRFYDVTEGRVLLDGHDVRELTLTSLRRQIALVTQETILFNDTVRNNIAYGNPAIPIQQIEAAAKAAGAHDFVAVLPEGYETKIGEQGARLSAGQRQRITIARAFLKNAPILILDEATSALDAESEALVQKALEALMTGRTSIVIAHRLSTIRRADCIHVLEGGRIVERGRHEELIASGGVYARLHALQFQTKLV